MTGKPFSLFSLLTTLALLVPGGASPTVTQVQPAAAPDRAHGTVVLRSASLMFIENVGQFDPSTSSGQAPRARFQVGGGTGTIWLAEDAIWVTVVEKPSSPQPPSPNLREGGVPLPSPKFGRGAGGEGNSRKGVNLRFSFPGANPHPRLEPFDPLDTVVSYFIGNDPAKWYPDVPVWGGVRYRDLYPGIDLVVGAGLAPAPGRPQGSPLPWRLEVREGADLSAVRLRIEGAEAVALLAGGEGLSSPDTGEEWGGSLLLRTAVGDFTLPLLTAGWSGPPAAIAGHDVLHPFVPPTDQPILRRSDHRTTGLQDNPSDLLYSTFLGGSNWDVGEAIAVDGSGSAYVTGWTWSADFPTTPGAFDTGFNGEYDAFMVKVNGAGTALAYASFLGGSDGEWSGAIAVDGAGCAYVTGRTYSSDFPTTPGAFDTSFNGECDAFVVKVNATGSGWPTRHSWGGMGMTMAVASTLTRRGAST